MDSPTQLRTYHIDVVTRLNSLHGKLRPSGNNIRQLWDMGLC